MRKNTAQIIDYDVVRESCFGFLGLVVKNGAISALTLSEAPLPAKPGTTHQIEAIAAAVCAYLETGVAAGLPTLRLHGTPFQRRVWAELRRIPYGQTRTYGEIASELGSSARAVGGACRANPVMILVPCHRVVAASGLGGFAGKTKGQLPALKARLLAAEGVCAR